ncbi:unnamed protein product, partial [Ixodes persulcatus]
HPARERGAGPPLPLTPVGTQKASRQSFARGEADGARSRAQPEPPSHQRAACRDPCPWAVVQSVVPGGEADRTGLIRPGDVVLRVNGTCVMGFEHGNCLLGQLPDDASVTLELACNGALDGAD